ncbi:threonine/serine ThrE exporter family protein [Dermacoccaceae bacterium W4C1]
MSNEHSPRNPGHPERVAKLRDRAARAVRSQRPPTTAIGVRGDEDGPTDQQAREIIDLTLRVGEALLGTGASASDVTVTVLRLTRTYGLRSVHVDVTFTSITVSYHRGPFRDPMTVMRIVPTSSADFTRLEAVQALVRQIVEADEPGPVRWARERLDRIVDRPHPYQRWIVTVAMALLGGAVTGLLGGEPTLIVLSAVLSAIIDRVQRRMALWTLPAFFSQLFAAAIPTTVALVLWAIRAATGEPIPGGLTPSVMVATGVVVLLTGLSVVSTAQDTLDGYYVTAAGRAFEVMLLSGGVVAGVLITLSIGQHLGVPLNITPRVALSDHLWWSTLAAAICGGANAIIFYAGTRTVAISAATGAIGWLIFRSSALLGMEAVGATVIAALVVGAISQLVSTPLRVPSLAVATGGIVPLVPGLAVFRGIFEVVQRGTDASSGWTSLVTAATLGMAIAGGVSLGSLPVRRWRADRLQRRLLTRAIGDSRE